MNNTIKTELASSIIDKINDRVIDNSNKDDWHFLCFNQDYYIIGYYQASEWLKNHDLDAFEAIDTVKEYEVDHFGEFTTSINSEAIVNMLAYIYGEQLIYSFDVETVEELKEELESLID